MHYDRNIIHDRNIYFIGGSFRKTKDGEKCPTPDRIVSEYTCKKASDELGLSWGYSWSGPGSTPGCIFANDGRSKVFFNTVLSAAGSNAKYAEICTGQHLFKF